MLKLATPISHLFEERIAAQEIIDASDCLECRERSRDAVWPKQHLFHIDIDIIHYWDEKRKEYLGQLIQPKTELKLVSFQLSAACHEPVLDEQGVFQLGGKIYTREEMEKNAISNIGWLRTILKEQIQIAVENNNYYPTPAYQFVTDGDLISSVVKNSKIKFLYDIAHAQVTAHNQGISYQSYLKTLPLEDVIQLHICQPGFRQDGTAFDAHEVPDDSMYQHVLELVKKYPVKYLTVEYYKNKDKLIDTLNRFQTLKNHSN